MIQLVILSAVLFFSNANADLLERVALEDSLKRRVDDVLRNFDPHAKSLIRLDYVTYAVQLPGTQMESLESFRPNKAESADIAKISIDIFLTVEQLPSSASELIYQALPIEKNRVQIQFKKFEGRFIEDISNRIQVKSLNDLVEKNSWRFTLWLMFITISTVFAVFGFIFYLNKKKMNEFKEQMNLLTKAFLDNSGDRSSVPLERGGPKLNDSARNQNSNLSQVENSFAKMKFITLRELIADCYWTEHDSYASFIWRKISLEQKQEMISQVPYMKNYSQWLVEVPAQEEAYHEHPYFLDPSQLWEVSQMDLAQEVEKNKSLWHLLSPLRQNQLPLKLEEKIAAVQSRPLKEKILFQRKSLYRELGAISHFGELTNEDELAIFENPNLVPDQLKSQVKTLVWLTLCDQAKQEKILNQFDARSLAAAWVGPEILLHALEKRIPEKKMKMLQNYRTRLVPSRNSSAYQQIVEESLKVYAA